MGYSAQKKNRHYCAVLLYSCLCVLLLVTVAAVWCRWPFLIWAGIIVVQFRNRARSFKTGTQIGNHQLRNLLNSTEHLHVHTHTCVPLSCLYSSLPLPFTTGRFSDNQDWQQWTSLCYSKVCTLLHSYYVFLASELYVYLSGVFR